MIKAFHRLLSVTLAALLTVSVLALPVLATENLGLPDSTTPRTLTIYKYATIQSMEVGNAETPTEVASEKTQQNEGEADSGEKESDVNESSQNDSTLEGGNSENRDAEEEKPETETKSTVVGSEYKPVSNVIFDIYHFGEIGDDCPQSIATETALAWVADHASELVTSVVTDSSGCAVWELTKENVPDGIYLVVERENAAIASSSLTVPFLVSLPSTNVMGNGWNYDVIVEPKNIVLAPPSIEKDVVKLGRHQGGVNIGEKFSWIIRSEIPADLYHADTLNGKVYETYAKEYKVTDKLDSRLDYQGGLKVELAKNDKVIMTLDDTMYSLNSTAKLGVAGCSFSISLTKPGMKKIMQTVTTPAKAELRITFDTSINETAIPGENVLNNATLEYTNSLDFRYEPIEVTADEVPFVYTGGFKIIKVDSTETTKRLADAEFRIAASAEDAKNKNWLKDVDGKEIVLTTDKNGTASYRGISYDKESKDPLGGTYYWLVETKAPEGYTLLADPIKFTVNSESYKDTTASVMIKNSLTTVPKEQMPLTGNDVVSHWWVIAIILIVVALAAGIISEKIRRKNEH